MNGQLDLRRRFENTNAGKVATGTVINNHTPRCLQFLIKGTAVSSDSAYLSEFDFHLYGSRVLQMNRASLDISPERSDGASEPQTIVMTSKIVAKGWCNGKWRRHVAMEKTEHVVAASKTHY